jgi:hypothetical protein
MHTWPGLIKQSDLSQASQQAVSGKQRVPKEHFKQCWALRVSFLIQLSKTKRTQQLMQHSCIEI